jgi:hypothetical protein
MNVFIAYESENDAIIIDSICVFRSYANAVIATQQKYHSYQKIDENQWQSGNKDVLIERFTIDDGYEDCIKECFLLLRKRPFSPPILHSVYGMRESALRVEKITLNANNNAFIERKKIF